MYNFRCKICGAEFEKMPKICPTPGCGNRNPAMWENIAPAAPRPVLTDEELRELERRKSEERRRLESEEKARQREQQRAAEAERQRELDRLRYEEEQRYAAEQAKLRQEQQRQREEIERQRAEQEQLRQQADSAGQAAAYQNRQTGDFGGFGNTAVNVPQAQNEVSDQNNKKIIILLLIITLLLILLFAGILLIAMMKKSDRSRTSSKYSVEETTTVQTKKTKKTTESTTTTTKASTTTTTTEKITPTTTAAPTVYDDWATLPELILDAGKKDGKVNLEFDFDPKEVILPDGAENFEMKMYYLSSSDPDADWPHFDDLIPTGITLLNSTGLITTVATLDDDVKFFGAFKVEYDIGDAHYTETSPIHSVTFRND